MKRKKSENGSGLNRPAGCVFCCLYRSPPARKGRGEEAEPDPAVSSFSPAAAREPTRRQWRWRLEKTRRHCLVAPETLLNTVPACRRGPLKIPDCVGVVIVIFVYLF